MADVTFGYYMSSPPLVVKDRLIVGISGDAADVIGFLKAVDPETGKVLWTWESVPNGARQNRRPGRTRKP